MGFIKSNDQTDDIRFLEYKICQFKTSMERKMMLDGDRYYEGNHDIIKESRTVIGEGGELEEVKNLPDN